MVPLNFHHNISAFAEHLTFRRATKVTVESKAAIDFIKPRYPHLQLHQVEHSPNWMFFQTIRNPQISPIRCLSVGTLGHVKGTDLLLQGFEGLLEHRPAELVVISNPDPEYLKIMRSQVSSKTWDRIIFKSHLRPTEVAAELGKATLLLFPTRADNSPNAVKEAVVAGVPVVASRMGAIPDYVLPERNGYVFTPGDLVEFVAAILKASDHPLFGKGMVDVPTLNQIRESLSPSRMAESISALYSEIMREKRL